MKENTVLKKLFQDIDEKTMIRKNRIKYSEKMIKAS
jgi:hypothetical protein